LTHELNDALGPLRSLENVDSSAVNSIAWNGEYWMLAGGTPIAYDSGESQSAWVASFKPEEETGTNSTPFVDLTSAAIPNNVLQSESASSILSMSCISSGCALGGSDASGAILFWFNGVQSTDLSSGISSQMSYVQWVGLP
jgi:hypothetical protein